jgi:hypothetical protein
MAKPNANGTATDYGEFVAVADESQRARSIERDPVVSLV